MEPDLLIEANELHTAITSGRFVALNTVEEMLRRLREQGTGEADLAERILRDEAIGAGIVPTED